MEEIFQLATSHINTFKVINFASNFEFSEKMLKKLDWIHSIQNCLNYCFIPKRTFESDFHEIYLVINFICSFYKNVPLFYVIQLIVPK